MTLLHDRSAAQEMDRQDPLRSIKTLFQSIDEGHSYFCSNSLGLPPKRTLELMESQVKDWSAGGVENWFNREDDWYGFPERLRGSFAPVVGAFEDEVAILNSLTVNLHLLLTSFYRPKGKRMKVLMRAPLFPSDHYAVKSHLAMRGIDPEVGLVLLRQAQGSTSVTLKDVQEFLQREGQEIALVLIDGVNFLTGELSDIKGIIVAAHACGALAGCELAHAAGNIPLALHDWNADFAYGCSYKYLCGGPGAPGWIFVHRKHHDDEISRLAGWWGSAPATRFEMREEFTPHRGAASWVISTPPILALTPLKASLGIFQQVGMEACRKKSVQMTHHLYALFDEIKVDAFRILTPPDAERRGCQLSIQLPGRGEHCLRALKMCGVICDLRPQDVIRIAPFPLYNSFEEVFILGQAFIDYIRREL